MTPELERGVKALKAAFPAEWADGRLYDLGTFNCRRKNNTATGPWSEHAWANAIDVGVRDWDTPEGKRLGDRVAAWSRAHPELFSETFWQVAQHYNHVHDTANPRKNPDNKQVPPCAAGGDEMEVTKGIQRALNAAGFGPLTVDGEWGPKTEAAFTAAMTKSKKAVTEVKVGAPGVTSKATVPSVTVVR